MTLTLSCDHRILYGAEAAEFLAAIRDLLEFRCGWRCDDARLLRHHRHRRRPGRLRGRDPRRPARPEDRRGREGQGRRPLPQLRLHPGEDRAAQRRDLRRGAELGRPRHRRQGRQARLGRGDGAPRQGLGHPLRRRRGAVEEKQDRDDLRRGLADRRGQRQGRRGRLRGQGRDPRHRLGRDGDPRRLLRRPRPRHLGRLVAAGVPEEDRRRRRRRLRLGDRLRLRALRHRGDPDRDAAADPPRRGQRHRQSRRTGLQERGDRGLHRYAGRERRGRQELGQVHLRRQEGRGRLPGDRRRPQAPTSRR